MSRRTVELPRFVVDRLWKHRTEQAKERLMLGMGGAGPNDYVFATLDGGPIRPRNFLKGFSRIVKRAGARRR